MSLRKARKPLLFLVLLAVICLGSYFRWLEVFELITFDWRMRLRSRQPIHSDIAIIEIGNDSIKQIGRWPFDRKYHARLIEVLSKYGVKQIFFDVIFGEKTLSDDELIQATKRVGNVYFPRGKNVDLIEGLRDNCRGYGHINIEPDIDGKRRYIQPFIKVNYETISQLSILMASDYLGRSIKELNLPLDEKGRFIVNYAGTWKETYKHYSYADILVSFEQIKLGMTPRLNLSELKDKVCFVGLSAVGSTDIAATPLEVAYPQVGVNVNIFNSIITTNYVKRVTRVINLLILVLLLGLIVWLFRRSRGTFIWFLWITTLLITFLFSSIAIFIWRGLWIDLVYPITILLIAVFGFLFLSYIKERQRHLLLEHDLEIAGRLQQGFLTRTSLVKQGDIEIAARLLPCRHIGGDFYDIIKMDNGNLAVLIGDVTGKGVSASLYMSLSISIFRNYIRLYSQAAKILDSVNKELRPRYPPGIFTTAILLILDSQGRGYYANAGHTTLNLKSQDSGVSLDSAGGIPLGIIEDAEYSEAPINLMPQDTLILYTDGVLEAKGKGGEEFGEGRLEKLIKENDFLPAPVLAERILKTVSVFQKSKELEDDLTVIVIKKGG
jgi:serine phosphatase RsbU (regulator of sigma subunit)